MLSVALLGYLTSRETFLFDEWSFLLHRRGFSADVFLEPHNEHIVVIPVAIFKFLQEVFGMDSARPFQLDGDRRLHRLDLADLRPPAAARRRVGGARLRACRCSCSASADETLLLAFQLSFSLSLSFGLAAILVLIGARRPS